MTEMMKRITEENFKKAENKAFSLDISMAEAVAEFLSSRGEIEILEPCKVLKLVRPRMRNSHKGSFGKLVFIGGSDRYPGAAQLASMAALRSGVGLLNVITTANSAVALSVGAREATLLPLPADRSGFIDPTGFEDDVSEAICSATAVLIGCGLGKSDGARKILDIALENAKNTLIIDADGINLVSERIECLRKVKAGLILTPHPAELARLCGAGLDDVKANRFTYARRLAEEYGAVVAAKSSSTLIATGERTFLSVGGNTGLSRGGSGDFLAGLIGSLSAQGYSPADAVCVAVALQGACCEAATARLSETGTTVSDMIYELPELFKKIER